MEENTMNTVPQSIGGQNEIRSSQERLQVTFHSEEDIIRFVDTCNKYDDAIDIKVNKMSTDAKSIMGMLLMKIDTPLEIEYGCYDDEDNYMEFRADILEKFEVTVTPLEPDKSIG